MCWKSSQQVVYEKTLRLVSETCCWKTEIEINQNDDVSSLQFKQQPKEFTLQVLWVD